MPAGGAATFDRTVLLAPLGDPRGTYPVLPLDPVPPDESCAKGPG
jgi:hypothetical protein